MDNVKCLSSLPCNDGNFKSALSRAMDNEITLALDIMATTSGQNKGRMIACQRELRKRMKARNNQ